MLYLFNSSEIIESIIREYFIYKIFKFDKKNIENNYEDKSKIFIYDCIDKNFEKNFLNNFLFNNENKILIISNKDIEINESENLKIFYYKKSIIANFEDFKKQILKTIAWLIEPTHDFDHELYLKNNPNILNNYCNIPWSQDTSNRQKAYHHHLLHSSPQAIAKIDSFDDYFEKKLFLNENNSQKCIERIINQTASDLLIKFIKVEQNKLECICVNLSCKEQKEYEEFLERIKENTNINFSKNIDFLIITNNKKIIPETDDLKKLFKNVNVISLDLSGEEDLYIRDSNEEKNYIENKKIPDYGFKSGPNIMFLKTMELLKQYNTSLLLETDCYFSKDWLERLIQHSLHSNGFWISGSTYNGVVFTKSNSINLNHINGVALYSTGNPLFQIFINYFDSFLRECIKITPELPYDFAIKMMIDFGLNYSKNYNLWMFIKRNYLVNNHIFNFSTKEDKFLEEKEIHSVYNYAILHKKNNNSQLNISLH
jgi:hypothetical protein